MVLKVVEKGVHRDIPIKEGEVRFIYYNDTYTNISDKMAD